MKIRTYLIAVLLPFSLCGKTEPEMKADDQIWIRELSSKESAKADQAAVKLYQHGALSIPALISKMADKNPYKGLIFYQDFESSIPKEISTGLVCAYLVEAIARKNIFFETVETFASEEKLNDPKSNGIERLQQRYQNWWKKYQSKIPIYGFIPDNVPYPSKFKDNGDRLEQP